MGAVMTLRRGAYRLALATFRQLPAPARRAVVRAGTPSFTVGSVCALVREDRVLLLRQRHRPGWTLPGGLLDRSENGEVALRRELEEELRLTIDPGLPVTALVTPRVRRVDLIYRVDAAEGLIPQPRGEALEASWLLPEELGEDSAETVEILERLRSTRGGRL